MHSIYNYYALTLAIMKPSMTIDKAISHFSPHVKERVCSIHNLSDKDVEDMIAMRKQGMFYKDIAEIFGVSDKVIFGRIKRYKAKAG